MTTASDSDAGTSEASWSHQSQDTHWRTLVLGETRGCKIPRCHGLSARMLIVNVKLLTILEHAERHTQLGFPNGSLQFNPYFTDIQIWLWPLPPPWSSQTELGLKHRSAAWSVLELGRDCHTALQLQASTIHHTSWKIRLVHWGKKEKQQKKPHTPRALQQEWKILASHSSSGAFRAYLAQTLFLTSSTMTILQVLSQSSFPQGSSTVRNCSYTCTLKKKPKNLNMHTLSKQALKEWASSWFSHPVPAIDFVSACCSYLQDINFIAGCFLGAQHFETRTSDTKSWHGINERRALLEASLGSWKVKYTCWQPLSLSRLSSAECFYYYIHNCKYLYSQSCELCILILNAKLCPLRVLKNQYEHLHLKVPTAINM